MRFDHSHPFTSSRGQTESDPRPERATACSAITLPSIGKDVPKKLAFPHPSRKAWGNLMLALDSRNAIPEDIQRMALSGKFSFEDVTLMAFRHFVMGLAPSLEFLNLNITLGQSHSSLYSYMESELWERDKLNNKKDVHLMLTLEESLASGDHIRRVMKPVFNEVSMHQDGIRLFFSAYHALLCLSGKSLPLLTPFEIYDLARREYWRFAEDEQGFLRELREEDPDCYAEYRNSVEYTFRQLSSSFGWALEKPSKSMRLTRTHIQSLTSQDRPDIIRRLAKATLDALDMLHPGITHPLIQMKELEGDRTGWASIIKWSETDDTYRIVDDYIHTAYQGESTDLFAAKVFKINTVKDADIMLDTLIHIFPPMKVLDHLIGAMTIEAKE